VSRRLILFDIDGTLVNTGGAGGRAMSRAFHDMAGVEHGAVSIPMAGRTDAWIVSQIAERHGLACTPAFVGQFHDAYLEHLAREVAVPSSQKRVLPGVRPLLDALASQDDAFVALLTGNFRRGAEIKLSHFGLWDFFMGGAFGDVAHDRNALLHDALISIREQGGPAFTPDEAVIIGDTPLDVAVAVHGGARAVAVATGGHDMDELRRAGADVVLPDLSDRATVLQVLRG
jgi:phosphoglycolate phosphatase-like HAD superfamily hydrolase